MGDSMREALTKAYDDLEAQGSSEAVTTSRPPAPIVEPEANLTLVQGGKTEEQPVVGDKPNDGAKPVIGKPVDKGTAKPVIGKPADKIADKPVQRDAEGKIIADKPVEVGKFRAPQSWKPATRETWGKIPVEAQEEITRREGEISKALSTSAAARKFNDEFGSVIRPFETLIRASGVHPLQAVQNLMTTAAGLQTGTPAQKAGIIANVIKTYGVDIAMLDQMLSGQQPKGGGVPDEVIGAVRREIAPINEFMQEMRGARTGLEQRMQQEAAQTADDFANDPKNEFYTDLRDDIADLLDLAASRGRVMSLEEAYRTAASAHPEIAKIMEQRKVAEAATVSAGNVERARRAASSQPGGTPGGMGNNSRPAGRRDAVAAAFDALST